MNSMKEQNTGKRLVPYDLTKKEDRDALRGKWVMDLSGDYPEYCLCAFRDNGAVLPIEWHGSAYCIVSGLDLFHYFSFLDGSPVGKEVMEKYSKDDVVVNPYDNRLFKAVAVRNEVPFDLSDGEIASSLMNRVIMPKAGPRYETITNISNDGQYWRVNNRYTANELLKYFTFMDGSPCGMEVI